MIMLRKFSELEIKKLRNRFNSAKPFPYVIINNFFIRHRKLLQNLKKETFHKKDTDLFSMSQTKNLFYSGNKTVKNAVDVFCSKELSDLISRITGIRLKPGAADVSGVFYSNTDYLLCHDDRLEGRKIAFILYLSTLKKKDGGALAFYSDKKGHPYKKYVQNYPMENSLMVFKVSRKSWHEVEEVLADKERYSIGGWLH